MSDKPVVYAFCNGTWGPENQAWVVIADDGEIIANHISSSRSWGQRDVGPDGFYRDRYVAKFGEDFAERIEYRVLPEGEAPPESVKEAHLSRVTEGEAHTQPGVTVTTDGDGAA